MLFKFFSDKEIKNLEQTCKQKCEEAKCKNDIKLSSEQKNSKEEKTFETEPSSTSLSSITDPKIKDSDWNEDIKFSGFSTLVAGIKLFCLLPFEHLKNQINLTLETAPCTVIPYV